MKSTLVFSLLTLEENMSCVEISVTNVKEWQNLELFFLKKIKKRERGNQKTLRSLQKDMSSIETTHNFLVDVKFKKNPRKENVEILSENCATGEFYDDMNRCYLNWLLEQSNSIGNKRQRRK